MTGLYLIRGLPGAGKSTLAAALWPPVAEADDYFVGDDGIYRYRPEDLPQAHALCQSVTAGRLERGESCVVANTFSQRWELEPYLRLARESARSVWVTVVDLYDAGLSDQELCARCSHGVPVTGIARMRARWEHDWRSGDPSPPWDR